MRTRIAVEVWTGAVLLLCVLGSGPSLAEPAAGGGDVEFLEFLEYLGGWEDDDEEESWVELVDDRADTGKGDVLPPEATPEELAEVDDHA